MSDITDAIPAAVVDAVPATPTPAPAPTTFEKNIQYRAILYNIRSTTPKNTNLVSQETIKALLENESKKTTTAKLSWNKLSKTDQSAKLVVYVDKVAKERNYSTEEKAKLQKYLCSDCLDNRRIQRVKDVKYDAKTGTIIDIPNLVYNKATRHFTINNTDKHSVTLKSSKVPQAPPSTP